MTYKVDALGWFSEVNGLKVIKDNLDLQGNPDLEHGIGWTRAPSNHPDGYVFHEQAGEGSDISGTLDDRNVSCHFNVDQAGNIRQYVSALNYSWHVNAPATYRWWGIEHAGPPLNAKQLEASAALTAALVEYTKDRWGFDIPLKHVPGPSQVPGFKDHTDGTVNDWNQRGHTDRLELWTWPEYLERVAYYLEDDVDKAKVLDGAKRRVGQFGPPGPNADEDVQFGYDLADAILDKVKTDLGGLKTEYGKHGHVTKANKPTGPPVAAG